MFHSHERNPIRMETTPVTLTNGAMTQPRSLEVPPRDEHNQLLVANVHPPTWRNPNPAPRYNLVVIGAGTAGLVTAAGKNWSIRNNHIHDTFDGLSFMSLSWSEDCEVSGNRFERLVDNAVEAENHAQRLRVHDNAIVDSFEPFSYQPLGNRPALRHGGPRGHAGRFHGRRSRRAGSGCSP